MTNRKVVFAALVAIVATIAICLIEVGRVRDEATAEGARAERAVRALADDRAAAAKELAGDRAAAAKELAAARAAREAAEQRVAAFEQKQQADMLVARVNEDACRDNRQLVARGAALLAALRASEAQVATATAASSAAAAEVTKLGSRLERLEKQCSGATLQDEPRS